MLHMCPTECAEYEVPTHREREGGREGGRGGEGERGREGGRERERERGE